MKEVEIKIRNIDKDKIIEQIEKLGGIKNFTGKVIDYRFDTPDRKLSKQGKALRIRQKGKYFFLNLKGKKSIENITGRDEMGVKISNSKTMYRMLNELGFIEIFKLHKYRTEYKLGADVKFDIDEYLGMDPILEIESNNREDVEKYLKELNIKEKNIGRLYIREILAAKRRYEYDRLKRKLENLNKESSQE